MTESELSAVLERAICHGAFAPHCRLPSERELARRFGTGRAAIRKALNRLTEMGMLYRLERGGTFVSPVDSGADTDEALHALECVNFIETPLEQHSFKFAEQRRLQGFTRVLERYRLRVRFVGVPSGPDRFDDCLHGLIAPERQGCILGAYRNAEMMNWLHARKVPFVLHMYSAYDRARLPEHHAVFVNRDASAFQAVSHLAELGHRRIGFAGGLPGERLPLLSFEGYRSALVVLGRDLENRWLLLASGGSRHQASQAFRELLSRPERPTAIVCQNDNIAFDAIEAAHTIGLRVPRDLSVIGFDNDPAGEKSSPRLTTFGGQEEVGEVALETLFAVGEGRLNEFQSIPVTFPMILRQSTAPPPGNG